MTKPATLAINPAVLAQLEMLMTPEASAIAARRDFVRANGAADQGTDTAPVVPAPNNV